MGPDPARFLKDSQTGFAEIAFVVDEAYQGRGIASYLYEMLVRLARERGVRGFTADVQASNKAMMKVFERGNLTVEAKMRHVI